MSTTFFDLPRELRDKVYDFVWQDSGLFELHEDQICHSFGDYASAQHFAVPVTKGIPKWLLTSKSFLREGLSQFRHAGYVELSYENPSPYYIPPPIFAPRLISPSTVRILHVSIETSNSYESQHGYDFCCFLSPQHLNHLDAQLRSAFTHNRLRVLKIEISTYLPTIVYFPRSQIMAGLIFVLAPIVHLLDHLELSVSCSAFIPGFWNSLYSSLSAEVDSMDTLIEREWANGTKQITKVRNAPRNEVGWGYAEMKWTRA